MRCGDVNIILLENDIDEISPSIKIEVEKHILTCENCKTFYKAASAYNSVTAKAKELEPELNDELLYKNIMDSISIDNNITVRDKILNILSGLLIPVPKYAFGLLLVVITTFYFVGELNDLLKISELEKQYVNQQKQEVPLNSSINKADLFSNLNSVIGRLKISNNNSYGAEYDELVITQFFELTNLFVMNEIKTNNELKEYLVNIGLNPEKGLTKEDIEKLLRNKDGLERILNKNSLTGGK